MALYILGLLCFQTNLKIFCSYVKNAIGNLVGIALNLWISLGNIIILGILVLQIQEHGLSFHLFVSSLISFINVLEFSEYRSFVGRFNFLNIEAEIIDMITFFLF